MADDRAALLRKIPKVDDLLEEERVKGLLRLFPRRVVLEGIRRALDRLREGIQGGTLTAVERASLLDRVAAEVKGLGSPKLRRVINATGVVLHTNLGRAPLSEAALQRLEEVGGRYSNLEYDLSKGRRGLRYVHVEDLLCRLSGAEAAMVVNNNAGAVLLVLNTLAEGREVVVSRGELVEIGGAFRIPDVMAKSGAILREVGTTNRTHPRDYEGAINDRTALLLKVHTSNYRIVGFTSEVPLEGLVEIGRRYRLPVMEDLGSGLLLDLSRYGLKGEPTVQGALARGADVVTFSGDKLLGGPQAGIILGKREIVEEVRKNPLTRALRIDKLTLAALEATLFAYLDEEVALEEVPALRMLTTPLEVLKKRARRLQRLIRKASLRVDAELVREASQVGGGAFPFQDLPTWAVSVRPLDISLEAFEEGLRLGDPPVVARISGDRVLFDARTIADDELPLVAEAVAKVLSR
ncbi:MAG: L-seryl-tRNA(Sec) selenium transferase [Deltaproteobacteria bacterium]|nr:MAG: L-seryl-tRNA(Sec) selenium transferase [Deltaproteobacteria bacterium]